MLDHYKHPDQLSSHDPYKPKKDEPKIWFNSIKSLAQVLSEENQVELESNIPFSPSSP